MTVAKIIVKKFKMPSMAVFNDAFRRLTGGVGRHGLGWGDTTAIIGNTLAIVNSEGKVLKSVPLFTNGTSSKEPSIQKITLLAEGIHKQ